VKTASSNAENGGHRRRQSHALHHYNSKAEENLHKDVDNKSNDHYKLPKHQADGKDLHSQKEESKEMRNHKLNLMIIHLTDKVVFSERKEDQRPTSRKKPAFRKKKVPVDSGDVNLAATSQFNHLPERKERKEERSSNPYHLDRPEKQFADDRAPYKDKNWESRVLRQEKGIGAMLAMAIPGEEINLLEGKDIFLVKLKLRSGNMIRIKTLIRTPFQCSSK